MTDALRIDGQKLQFHPRRVAQWLDGKDQWETAKEIYPIYMELSPIGGCNHACLMCGVDYVIEGAKADGKKIPQLDADMMHVRLQEMGALGVKSVMWAGSGEPTLHKRMDDMVRSARQAGIDVAFTTNGTVLNKLATVPECNWIKVSINGGTRDTYAQVHRCKPSDWDRVWENVADAITRKGQCMIGAQLVVLPENQHEVDAFQEKCAEVGLDYCVIKPFSQHKFSINRQYENFIPIVPAAKFGNVVVRSNAMQTRAIPYEKCQATPYMWAYVEANGDVYSCSAYLLDDRFRLGNLNTHTFKEVWHGEKRRANLEYVRETLDIHECRVNCRMNKVNEYLTELQTGVPGQAFI